MNRREDGRPIDSRWGASCGRCHAAQARFEATALMRDGTLFVSTPLNRVLAFDAETGTTRWIFDPQIDKEEEYPEQYTSRGVSMWVESATSTSECARRIFLATIDARLMGLDAATGRLCDGFGVKGVIDLRKGAGANNEVVTHPYSVTSPPAIVNDVVVVGSSVTTSSLRDPASAVVRAFDVRTGALRWSFDPIPRNEQHPARSTWSADAMTATGGANVWSIIAADGDRDLVFLPTASAAPNHYGGLRPGAEPTSLPTQ